MLYIELYLLFLTIGMSDGLIAQGGEVSPHRFLEAEIQRVAYKSVTDRYFVEIWQRGVEVCEVVKVEIMAGIDPKSQIVGGTACFDKWSHGALTVLVIKIGVWLGIQLDAVSTDGGGSTDIVDVGADEYR